MIRATALLTASAAAIALAMPAAAQDHSMHDMPGMSTPAAKPQNSPPKAKSAAPRRRAPAPRPAHRTDPAKPGKPNAPQTHEQKGMDHTPAERTTGKHRIRTGRT